MAKKIKQIGTLFALILGIAVLGKAQAVTSGNVDFSVTVNEAFDFRADGNNASGANTNFKRTAQAANGALGIILTIMDASPNINNSLLTQTVPFRIRSNRSYQLTATRAGTSTANSQDFDSSDIEMRIMFDARPSSPGVFTPGVDMGTNGWSLNTKKVSELSLTPQQIAAGDRVSLQGNNLSTNNFITGDLRFRVKRQYYTPTSMPFTEQVQIGISAKP